MISVMRIVAEVRLCPSPHQHTALLATLEQTNAATNHVSRWAWDHTCFQRFGIHKAIYHPMRHSSGLAAQVVCLLIAKVAHAYKLDRRVLRTFRARGAIAYDARIMRFVEDAQAVSLWTVAGRQIIPFVCGEHQRALLDHRRGECDLLLRGGKWFLAVGCEVAEAQPIPVTEWLGVDLGVVNLATDSDGVVYSGAAVERSRRIHSHRRRNLQRKRTRPARRKLNRLKGRQQRFQKNENHRISKSIVAAAQRTARGIALEDLGGIRERVTARKPQRARLANWSFYQLRAFVTYKARRVGVPVRLVDPRNTSRECPACGHIEKANRLTQSSFQCVSCGFAGHADTIAAANVAARAAVNRPMVRGWEQSRPSPRTSRRLSVGGS